MKEDNTPTVTRRTRTASGKLRLRLDTAKSLRRLNQRRSAGRQQLRQKKANAREPDPEKHELTASIPRLKKNTLARPPTATVKYKRRQVTKTWLPTHMWHTKRARMTLPTQPLWRMAIPLNPTEKSYRPTHRASGARGCVAWDSSYMSTIACMGTEKALDSLLTALDFHPDDLSQTLRQKWKAGTRYATGWVSERDDRKRPISPVTTIWFPRLKQLASARGPEGQPAETNITNSQPGPEGGADAIETVQSSSNKSKAKLDHKILILIHPSAFHQFWLELMKVAKLQKPQVLIEDLRFEIGSIEVQGPGSSEALSGVLRPVVPDPGKNGTVTSTWPLFAGLHNPNLLPHNSMLTFDVSDPRLDHPPKQAKSLSTCEQDQLDEFLVSWPLDKFAAASNLLSHKARWNLSRSLPSQKAINRRRAVLPPGQRLSASAADPQIPVIALASPTTNDKRSNSQGRWTILLPWSCVDPVWRSLMYYPLSTGNTPCFGGLEEKQQLAFERCVPWFPGDLPGTEAGKAWERIKSEERFDAWIRRPPKHRIAWETLDLGAGRRGEVGRGWTCDWEYLVQDSGKSQTTATTILSTAEPSSNVSRHLITQRHRKAAKAKEAENRAHRRNTSSPESDAKPDVDLTATNEVEFTQLTPAQGLSLVKNASQTTGTQEAQLVTVKIRLLDRGTPAAAARIYRLPTSLIVTPEAPGLAMNATSSSATSSRKSQQQSWSSHGPPPAQAKPPTPADSTPSSFLAATQALRARWLALDTHVSSDALFPKIKTNRFDVPRHQAAYPRESLANINVLPKNAPRDFVDKWGRNSAFGKGDGEVPKQAPPAPKDKKNKNSVKKAKTDDVNALDALPATVEDLEHLINNPFVQQTEWDKHPPCPDPHDLVGFVTSGGYNLAEGRGTAIGSLWAQRLLEGWKDTGFDEEVSVKEKERRKRLCIVRNAGESIGRLAIWEVCS
jgi:ribonuclease P/MRP protein subunit POP1